MAGKKNRSPRVPRGLLRPLVRFAYRRRAALAAGLVLTIILVLSLRVWRHIGDDVLAGPQYTLAPHQIRITPPPPWIRADIKAQSLRQAGLDGPLSIVDERLAERLARMFLLHPWVMRVERVTKHYPSRVVVDLVYRRPVAMVEVPGGLFPIDDQAVLLPSEDFSPADLQQYPRIAGIDSQPLGAVGTGWGDQSVLEAARIAVALADIWHDLRLHSIRRTQATNAPTPHVEFELVTKSGTTIPWGRAPGSESSIEAPLAEKLARLKKYAAEYGGLDESTRRNDLDLRQRGGTRTAALKTQTYGSPLIEQ